MLNTTGLSTTLAALVHGRSTAGMAQLRLQMSDNATSDQPASQNQELPLELSPARILVLPVAVFVVTVFTIDFSHVSQFINTLWPVNAIILVALLRYKRNLRNFGSIIGSGFCAIALACIVTGTTPASSVIVGAANILEVGIVLALLSVFRISVTNFTNFRSLLIFIIIAGGIAPFASDALAAVAVGSIYGITWRLLWLHLYPAHALGMIIVVPLLVSVTSRDWYALHLQQRLAEAIAVLAVVLAVCAGAAYFRPFIFMIVPAILFATVRFGLVGATVATLLTALIAAFFVVMGIGESLLSRPELSDRILALQVILAFTSLWSLPTAALLTERDRLLSDLSLANSQLKMESERKNHLVMGLRRHLSIAEEKERLRLSYELHDQAGQALIAAILELNEIDALIVGPAHERLHLVRKRMEQLGKMLHRIAWELRPPAIDELGLKKALGSYIVDWSEQCGTDVDFHCDDPNIDDVPSEIGTAIYRIVQEALTNIVKHAGQPTDVSVVISCVNATLQVIIEDNGCGFDVGANTAKTGGYHGLGLDGMHERLLLIGGTLEIESTPGMGTALFARIALDAQRSAA
jgi:signal transduction histidine kinase